MTPQVLDALLASIDHWQDNAIAKTPRNATTSPHACALCRLFFAHYCEGCPIMEATGMESCRRTPYWRADSALDNWTDLWKENRSYRSDRDAFIAAAKAELEFLQGLLLAADAAP